MTALEALTDFVKQANAQFNCGDKHATYNKQTIEFFEKVIANEQKRAVPPGWNPIETAPKDGTLVLLHEKWTDSPFIGWFEHGEWRVDTEHVSALDGIVYDSIAQKNVIFWAPLPPHVTVYDEDIS